MPFDLAERYRLGRLVLGYDAAHIHPPHGGRAQPRHPGRSTRLEAGGRTRRLGTGRLLDSYHTERHPVAAAVLDNTCAQMALLSTEPGAQAMRHCVGADGLRAGAPAPDR